MPVDSAATGIVVRGFRHRRYRSCGYACEGNGHGLKFPANSKGEERRSSCSEKRAGLLAIDHVNIRDKKRLFRLRGCVTRDVTSQPVVW